MRRSKVALVGAGPGDPELITVRGQRLLEQAEVVVHDRLVDRRLIDLAPASARRIDVGKRPGHRPWPQARINRLLVAEAARDRRVVRLKGGDPFVFGRGGEECAALASAGIDYEVVPGISSALAAPAFAGIPLTHRELSHSFTVVTGHLSEELESEGATVDWDAAARSETIVILMGLGRLPAIAGRLQQAGRDPATPVAVVERATTSRQRIVRGTLQDIALRAASMEPPATIVVGRVVDLAQSIASAEAVA